MIKYTLPSLLAQNILEKITLPSLKRSLNFVLLGSYIKTYISLLHQNSISI
jgi:hypothetical protein